MASSGSGGKPGGLNPNAPEFKPIASPPPPRFFSYTREFSTAAQQQAGRGRSYSFGVFDAATNTRFNRAHQHVDDFAGGNHDVRPKPPAFGAPGQYDAGNVTHFQPL
ncbi:PABP-interacting PAM2 motif-containing protein [Chitinolyticbacter meiyuanensis]|uniref:PABP-interacting PAM2 motif-containing protein n=1 Tax=Chitinolyticbacter meiyuanensis TaxID=682798 RepID=UPI0011E5CE9A|nr:PABP-interacting PAM2 motif-containing protein [Chitinolyticbacter meiyuanensis]